MVHLPFSADDQRYHVRSDPARNFVHYLANKPLATEKAIASWNEFSQVESGTGFVEGTLVQSDLLPHNSKVGIRCKEPDVEVTFTASRGPIYMMFIYYFQASGDLVLDFGSIQHLAILQIEKLEAAGYPE